MNETRFNVEDLLLDAVFPHPVSRLQLKQTHISWVLLTGTFAYKIKKPVRYDFIDASTLERRKFLCEEELRLNRRFASDLYVEVVAIVARGKQMVVGGHGNPLEFAVKMRQFDPSQELAELLTRDGVTAQDMRSLAGTVADSHIRAAVASSNGPYGTFPRVQAPILGNFELLRRHLGGEAERTSLEQLAVWTYDSLARLKPLIQSRLQSGEVRECHGDLHARNIVRWQRLWLPFDCLEFDPELRWIDVMADTAFLFMDLVSRRREDLACEFLSRYLEQTGDYAGLRLLPLYASYRALVRAKVDALGAESASPAERSALQTRLTERLATASRFKQAALPAVVIMHGVTASGKSWLSERMVSAIHALRIRSDLERKRLQGIAPLARRTFGVGEGAYSASSTQKTYERLLELADPALDGNCNVVIDATFLDSAHRKMFRALAQCRHCRFVIVSCASDPTMLASRLQARARDGLDPSEATEAVLGEQLRTRQPLTAEELQYVVEVDTSNATTAGKGIMEVQSRLGMPN